MKRLTILTVLLLPLLVGCETILEGIRDYSWQNGDSSEFDRASSDKPLLSQKQLQEIAKAITVKINDGSGVIIGKQGNKYLILTNSRTAKGSNSISIQTHDDVIHQARVVETDNFKNKDLALLEFTSENKYQLAVLERTTFLEVGMRILAAGYTPDKGLKYSSGKINIVTDKALKEGYQIGYISSLAPGMSGGPILNVNTGKLIGINGVLAYQEINPTLAFSDGIIPNQDLVREIVKSKWGIPVENVLARLKPEFLTRYSLPVPQHLARELTGKAAEIDKKAREITVRIEGVNKQSGSGIIIGRENNIYYVLTANEVIENTLAKQEHIFVITPDGKRYQIEKSNLTTQPGANLAVVKFSSIEQYRTARIGNYQLRSEQQNIFVSGWIEPQKNQLRNWYFSPGIRLENYQDASKEIAKAASYDLQYTNLSYKGTKGGPLLDSDGRLIGIHGQTTTITTVDRNNKKIELPLGSSAGISINTFLNLSDRLQIPESVLKIEPILPQKLNPQQQQEIQRSGETFTLSPNSSNAQLLLRKGNSLWRSGQTTEAIAAYDRAIALNPPILAEIHLAKGIVLQQADRNEEAISEYSKAVEIKPDFADAWYLQAIAQYNSRQYPEATQAIAKAIELNPKNYQYFTARGLILHDSDNYSESIKAYSKAIELLPHHYLYSLRGIANFDSGDYNAALTDFNSAIELLPNDPQNKVRRGNTYVELEQYSSAIADLTAAITIQKNPAIAVFAYNARGLARIRSGDELSAKEDFTEAIEQSDLAIARQPQNPKLYFIRGITHIQLKDTQAAIADFSKAIEIDPQNATAYKFRADLQFELDNLDAALKDYTKAIELDPENPTLYFDRAKVYSQQSEYQKAIEDYTKTIAINPEYPQAYKNRANTRLQTDDRQGAIEDYSAALKYNKDDASIYFLRGLTYFHLQDKDKAIKDYNRAIFLKPDYVEAYNSRGITLFEMGKYNEAIADFNKAIEIDPDYADAYTSRGSTKYQLNDKQGAIEDYTKALQHQPSGPAFVYSLRGNVYSELNESQSAIADYTKAIEIKPDLVQAYQQRANLYIDNKKYQRALADLNKVIEYQPNSPQAYYSRAEVYAKLGQYELARQDSNTALKYQSDLHLAYYIRGVTYLQLDQYQKATADAKQLIDRQPDLSEGYLLQGAVYQKEGNYHEALEYYQKALEKNQQNWSAYTNIGFTKYETHLVDEAIASWERAIKINPNEAQPHLALATALYTYYPQKDKQRALEMAQKALELDPRLANKKYLQQHTLWGKILLTDTTNILSDAKITQFLASQ